MQRNSHGLLWMDMNQLGSGHGAAAAEHTKREAHNFRRPTAQKGEREKENAPIEIMIWWRWAQATLFHWKSWNLAHIRRQDSPLCCVFDLHPTTTADDDGADLEKAPLHFHARRSGPHKQQQHLDSLTDWRTAGACISHNQSPFHLTN